MYRMQCSLWQAAVLLANMAAAEAEKWRMLSHQRHIYEETFKKIDKAGTGYISQARMGKVFDKVGHRVPHCNAVKATSD